MSALSERIQKTKGALFATDVKIPGLSISASVVGLTATSIFCYVAVTNDRERKRLEENSDLYHGLFDEVFAIRKEDAALNLPARWGMFIDAGEHLEFSRPVMVIRASGYTLLDHLAPRELMSLCKAKDKEKSTSWRSSATMRDFLRSEMSEPNLRTKTLGLIESRFESSTWKKATSSKIVRPWYY